MDVLVKNIYANYKNWGFRIVLDVDCKTLRYKVVLVVRLKKLKNDR